MKRIFLFIVILIFTSNIFAQDSLWQNYLCSKSINALALEDSIIWAATDGGIVEIDKVNDKTFFFNSSNSNLSDNNILDLAVDLNGDKWFITRKDGLLKYDNYNWTKYNSENSELPNTILSCVTIDHLGNKWIGTNGAGLI